MIELLRSRFKNIQAHLTSIDTQPLNKASLIIVIFLDLFILISIFDGLEKHTSQISAPDDYVPIICREIILNREWNPTNRMDNLSGIITSDHRSFSPFEDKKIERHPVCTPYLDLIYQIKNSKELIELFEDREKFSSEAIEIQREVGNLKGAYDTSLLETIAKQKDGQSNVDTLRKNVQAKSNTLDALRAEIGSIENKINGDENVRNFFTKLDTLSPADHEILKSDLRTINFWYPVKKLAMQLIFLLPLFAAFYFWNNVSINNHRGIQMLVSSHLLIVSFIPIFFKIVEAIYDILPKVFLKKLIDLLESLKLVALWNYLMITMAVIIALFLIYIFQQKLFSREKIIERRISKGMCQQCGKMLPIGSMACSFCGFIQARKCTACNQPTYVFGRFCKSCGKEQ